jgi:predicted nucleotidyltransferase
VREELFWLAADACLLLQDDCSIKKGGNEAVTSRKEIIETLISDLKPLDYIHAMWEMGSASFNRLDRWSDIDLMLVCDDDKVEDTLAAAEKSLTALSELDIKFRLPEPTGHGHAQVFWRLKSASPFLFLDLVVMKRSSKDKFLQHEIHGAPVVHFDKTAVVRNEPVDKGLFERKLRDRLEAMKATYELFQVLTEKELNRGNDIHAYSFYVAYTFRPLVMVLRMKYNPVHYDFFTAYLYHELPGDVVNRLRVLYLTGGIDELRKAHAEARKWFWETVTELDNRPSLFTQRP